MEDDGSGGGGEHVQSKNEENEEESKEGKGNMRYTVDDIRHVYLFLEKVESCYLCCKSWYKVCLVGKCKPKPSSQDSYE